MKLSRLFVTAGSTLLASSIAIAQGPPGDGPGGGRGPGGPGGKGRPPFEEIDTDGNKSVSFKEFMASQEKRIKEMFERLDENKDGALTKDEMARPPHRKDESPLIKKKSETNALGSDDAGPGAE